ncbi:MAG: division/cell wall cluster transcriptional repressor MraZ [Bacteroidota bacterium]
MSSFIGDYTCKVDTKGRIMLPSAFKRQMAPASQDVFVVKKDIYENCLVLYTMNEWERQNEIIRENTNPYNREHNQFLRGFFRGTAEINADATNRILIPRRLLDEAGINNEVVMAGQGTKIEIWAKEIYEGMGDKDGFAKLAEKIMGKTVND